MIVMIVYGPARGKTCFLLDTASSVVTKSGIVSEHAHVAVVDAWGNGRTTMNAGHRHEIADGEVLRVAGHRHVQAGGLTMSVQKA